MYTGRIVEEAGVDEYGDALELAKIEASAARISRPSVTAIIISTSDTPAMERALALAAPAR